MAPLLSTVVQNPIWNDFFYTEVITGLLFKNRNSPLQHHTEGSSGNNLF